MPDPQFIVLVGKTQLDPMGLDAIRQALAEGRIEQDDLVRHADSPDWMPLSELLAAHPEPTSSNPTPTPTPASENSPPFMPPLPQAPAEEPSASATSPIPPPSATLGSRIATSGKIASLQAHIEKIRRFDLRAAVIRLGTAAHSYQISAPAGIAESYSQIDDIDRRHNELRNIPEPPTEAAVSDKAKHQALKAKNVIQIEKLVRQRRDLLNDVGSKLALDPPANLPDEAASALTEVRGKVDELHSAEAELEELRQKVGGGLLARPGRILAAVAILAGVVFLANQLAPTLSEWKNDLAHKRSLAKLEKIQDDAQAQRERVKLERERASTLRRAESEADHAARRLSDQQHREEQAKVSEQKRVEAEKQASIESQQAQLEREQHAARILSAVRLQPDVVFSGSMQRLGATLEMRGQGHSQLAAAQQAKDWLGMIAILEGRQPVDYPTISQIDNLARKLESKRFQILVTTRHPVAQDSRIYCVNFERESFQYSSSWQRHLDRINGLLRDWSANDGDLVIIEGSQAINSQLRNFDSGFDDYVRAQRQKLQIGETTSAGYEASINDYRERAHATLAAWAKRS